MTLPNALRYRQRHAYGLAGGVWTQSLSTAHKMAKWRTSRPDDLGQLLRRDRLGVGFGGYKMSGYGWKGGAEHVDSFLYQKAVYMNIA